MSFTVRLFEFFRNEALNARNLFATTGPKPRFRRNQYGFVLGGPIQRTRRSSSSDYQGTRLQVGTVRTSTVPTTLQRQGIFSAPRSSIPRRPARPVPVSFATGSSMTRFRWTGLTRQFEHVLDRYPAPNVFVNGQEAAANNYRPRRRMKPRTRNSSACALTTT